MAPSRPAQLVDVDLVAGHEEEEGDAELAQQLDRGVIDGQPQTVGADEHPAQDEQDDLGYEPLGDGPGDQRRHEGHRDDEQQGGEDLGHIVSLSPVGCGVQGMGDVRGAGPGPAHVRTSL